MTPYDNYSPEIPLIDDLSDSDWQQPKVTVAPEPRPAPSRRRRAVRQEESVREKKKAKETKTKAPVVKKEPSVPLSVQLQEWIASPVTRMSLGIVLGGLGVWMLVAFFSYFTSCVADQSLVNSRALGEATQVGNPAGEGGARLTEMLINNGFGLGAGVIVIWLIGMSLKQLVGYPKFKSLSFTIKCLVALISVSVVVGMLTIGLDTPVNWGGFHGRYINELVYNFIGWTGATILSIVLVSLFVIICLRDLVKWILRKKRAYDEKKRVLREQREAELQKEAEIMAMAERERKDEALSGEGAQVEAEPEVDLETMEESVAFSPEEDTIFDTVDIEEDEVSQTPATENSEDIATAAFESAVEPSMVDEPDKAEQVVPYQVEEPEEKTVVTSIPDASLDGDDSAPADEKDVDQIMTVNVNQIEKGTSGAPRAEGSGLFTHVYNFPPADFLRPGKDRISVDADEQMENKEKIRKTLLDFGIPITSIEATVGPTVTLYEIRPDTGVKIAKIRNLVDDIALSLSAIGVRIIAPIPGKGTVGIEVANKDPQTVSMRTIIQSKAYQDSKYKLPVALGSTISNDVYIADLAKMPHLLVAGATGQGKSVGLNAIITSLLYSKRPEELKFVMVDPKRVEFSLYSKIENYYLAKIPDSNQPIITKMENVVATLSSLCEEMDERYRLLEKAFVRQVSEYNEKFRENKLSPSDGHRFMPYIVVIIDEFADLIMTAGKEVEIPIARLAQLARAVGIHVIIATQRPSTNVITGMIKANFPVRIAFKVSSGIDSKTILDSTGAQQLIGRGDMLISNNGEMIRVQCAFVDTPEVEEVCEYIARQPYPQGAYILPEPTMGGDSDASEVDPASLGKKDPLLEEVARQVVMSGTASTSAVQRRYEIGYNRAGRIMDQLEAYGVVGPATGGKPRSVLVDPATLESILASIA